MASRLNYGLFLLLACFWGGSFVGIKIVIGYVPPTLGAALRVGLALLFLVLWFKIKGKKTAVPPHLRWRIWLTGIFAQGLPFCLLFWGEKQISPGLAGIFNGTVSLWTFFIGLIFLPRLEVFSAKKLAGLLIGWTGIAVISLEAFRFGGGRGELMGMIAVSMMAASYAVGTLLSRYLLSGPVKVDFHANLYHQHCASLTFLVLVTLLTGQWVNPSTYIFSSGFLMAILYLSFFSTAVAWIFYYHLIREWGAVRASTVTYLVPIMALFWDFVFFSTVPSLTKIVGASFILCGVVLIQMPLNFNFIRQRCRLPFFPSK